MGVKFVIPTIFTAFDRTGSAFNSIAQKTVGLQDKLQKTGSAFMAIGRGAAVASAAILVPLGAMAKSAIDFEDKMADVGKTTGLQGAGLQKFGDDLLTMSTKTRTSIDDLLSIGEIGGQLGVAKDELLAFTGAADKFSVALGADYAGGTEEAITQVSKLKSLFKETRDIPIAEAITKSGSAINELGATGAGTSANINEFMLRVGQLPEALKPGIKESAALGTFFEEAGLNAEIASGGFSDLLVVAARELPKFAAQMGMSTDAARQLLQTDPSQFAATFAKSLAHLKPDQLGDKLHDLKIGSKETLKVVGALGSGQERLAELTAISSKAFEEGTSLSYEYDKKNNTLAGRLAQTENNFKVLSITVGTQLIPIIGKLLDKVIPIIQSLVKWAQDNPQMVQTIVQVVGAVGVFVGVISALAFAIGIIIKAQTIWNFVMTANPIGLIITAILIAIGVVIAAIAYWDEWGAAILAFLGPIGWLINVIISLKENWLLVEEAFKEDGILGAILAIGKVLLNAILYPLEQILDIASNLPGKMGTWAKAGADAIHKMREEMETDKISIEQRKQEKEQKDEWERNNTPVPARYQPPFDPKTAENEALVKQIMFATTQRAQAELVIKDETGRAEVTKAKGITPNLTPTTGQFGRK